MNISQNEIGDNGVKYLWNLLENQLSLFDISFNKIGNEGVRHLSISLQKSQTLISININHNQIDDYGLHYLSNVLRSNQVNY